MKVVLELSFDKATDDTVVRYCVEIKDAVLWQAIENLISAITAVDMSSDKEEKLPWVGGHRFTRGRRDEEEKIPWGHCHGLQGDGKIEEQPCCEGNEVE